MADHTSFGSWLRERRRAVDLTQEELAQQVGCSAVTIRRIEAGWRRPSKQLSELLALHLDIPLIERPLFMKMARGQPLRSSSASQASDSDSSGAPAAYTAHLIEHGDEESEASLQLPPFVGRAAELEEIGQLLWHEGCRLLTLVGPGGIGKTRLALQAAVTQQGQFSDGIHQAFLAPLNAVELLPATIASALGFCFYNPGEPREQLLSYLRDKQLLLVLDNFEHLRAGSQLLTEIARQAPGVRLLVTSRERLSLREEWVFEVQGLPVPDSAAGADGEFYAAVQLFLHCARRAGARLALSEDTLKAIICICQLVEGMPLGIELAAPWSRVLSCSVLAAEIERSIDLLETSLHNTSARHRSVRAVFEQSWSRLSEEEQRAFSQLSVFYGGFRRDAAERVAEVSLSLLAALVDKSLVRRANDDRYHLHALLRQYAEEKQGQLPGTLERTGDQHCRYYAALVARRARDLKSHRQLEAATEIETEIDNIHKAWGWAVTHRRAGEISLMSEGLWYFYEIRNWFEEGAHTFARAVAVLEEREGWASVSDEEHTRLLGIALTCQGFFYSRRGLLEEGGPLLERAVTLLRPLSGQRELAMALGYLGFTSYFLGAYAHAKQQLEESLGYARMAGDEWQQALCYGILGLVANDLGEDDEASRLLHDALAIWQQCGDERIIAICQGYLGQAAFKQHKLDEAARWLRQSLAGHHKIGDRFGLALCLKHLGLVVYARGTYQEARQLLQESLGLFRQVGDRSMTARALNDLAQVVAALGEDPRPYLYRALQDSRAAQTLPEMLKALVALAVLLVQEQQVVMAAELLTVVLQHPTIGKATRDRAEQVWSELASAQPATQVAAIGALPGSRSLEDVVAELLMRAELSA